MSEFYAGDVVMVQAGGRWREAVVRHVEPMTVATWYTVSLRDGTGWNEAEHPVCDRVFWPDADAFGHSAKSSQIC